MTVLATLCYIKKGNQVLLQKKSKELFGGDKYNAPGGKLQENEDPKAGVIREVKEETGLDIKNLKNHGTLYFYDGDESKVAWQVYVFSTEDYDGELKSQVREGIHEWVDKDQIPYDKMWEDDKWWMPFMFEGKQLEAHFYFEKGFGPVYKHKIKVKHNEIRKKSKSLLIAFFNSYSLLDNVSVFVVKS